jgi:hypothetical protein
VVVRAVGVLAEPGVLVGMRGREIVRPKEPKLTKGELGLEHEILLMLEVG